MKYSRSNNGTAPEARNVQGLHGFNYKYLKLLLKLKDFLSIFIVASKSCLRNCIPCQILEFGPHIHFTSSLRTNQLLPLLNHLTTTVRKCWNHHLQPENEEEKDGLVQKGEITCKKIIIEDK